MHFCTAFFMSIKQIRNNLSEWHRTIDRKLPWKEDRNPYKIWVSEIILQQTRVAQGIPYYLAFLLKFPTLKHLAEANLEEVITQWEGLGYYSRARNLHKGANYIMETHNGVFPKEYEEILLIPGIGPYTAAAISSFAFDGMHAVVDGNVNRVLSRMFNIDEDLSKHIGKKKIKKLSQDLLEIAGNPASFNQAIMDFGATVCTPKPKCEICPMTKQCVAKKLERTLELPQKKTKPKLRKRWFHYLVYNQNGKSYIVKRVNKDIWKDLFEFPMQECSEIEWKKLEGVKLSQKLSHQHIHACFTEVKKMPIKYKTGQKVDWKNISSYSFPRLIRDYIGQR